MAAWPKIVAAGLGLGLGLGLAALAGAAWQRTLLERPHPAPQVPIARSDPAAYALALTAAHAAEPADPSWATAMRTDIDSDLAGGAFGAERVTSIDCRSSTCIVMIEWSNYGAARAAAQALAVVTLRHPCGRTVSLIPPSDDAQEGDHYTGMLHLDCGEEHASPD